MGMGIKIRAEAIARKLEHQEHIHIITHCDADGITGAAIAKKALDERGISHDITVVNYLTNHHLDNGNSFTWFIDLANSYASLLAPTNTAICDHHFGDELHPLSMNPFYFGMDGEVEISGAGLSFLVASALTGDDDATLAIIGALGDLQDVRNCRLIGLNKLLLAKSRIVVKKDLRIYGRDKPLFKMLVYASDPPIPNIFKRHRNAIGFLTGLGIEHTKCWAACTNIEKQIILSALIKLLISKGFGYEHTVRLFGEVYELEDDDARNHATLLNALGKYGDGLTAISMCVQEDFNGDHLRKKHRECISKFISYARDNLDGYGNLHYFHGGTYILDTVVGTVAGMLLREEEIIGPLLAFVENNDGIKVSARASSLLIQNGLNLSTAMKHTAQLLGGDGGGHRAAAGALIPKGREEDFLKLFDTVVKNQLS